MRKAILTLFLMLGLAGVASAQNITVDLGATYASGFTDFTALNPQGYNGNLQQGVVYSVILNSVGVANVTLNAGQQYRAMACKSDGTACLLATVNVTGQAQDISAALQAYVIGSGSGSVTSMSVGTLFPLFTTGVATATTTPALSFTLSSAAGGTLFGRSAGTTGAPAYTSTPVLGIPTSVLGTLGFAGNTSGTVTVSPAAVAGTWTFMLPANDGDNLQVLQTNGSGVTSWATPSAGAGTVTNTACPTITAGYIPFGDGASDLNCTANFAWNNTARNITSISGVTDLTSNGQPGYVVSSTAAGAVEFIGDANNSGIYWNTTNSAIDAYIVHNPATRLLSFTTAAVVHATLDSAGRFSPFLYGTATNCSDSAGDAACGAAAAGSIVVDAGDTTTVVSSTAVTANSQIFLFDDSSLGTRLSVTCNTTPAVDLTVTARTDATSFTITTTSPITNPRCLNYLIIN